MAPGTLTITEYKGICRADRKGIKKKRFAIPESNHLKVIKTISDFVSIRMGVHTVPAPLEV